MNVSKSVLVGVVLVSMLSTVAISQVFSVVTDGGNPFDAIWEAISGLEARVETLEEQSPSPGFMSAPAYDSGWMAISPGVIVCEHNLGTFELFVYVVGRWVNSDLHQMGVGGFAYYYDDDWYNHGLSWWALNTNQIEIARGTEDVRWEEVRVYIWVIP